MSDEEQAQGLAPELAALSRASLARLSLLRPRAVALAADRACTAVEATGLLAARGSVTARLLALAAGIAKDLALFSAYEYAAARGVHVAAAGAAAGAAHGAVGAATGAALNAAAGVLGARKRPNALTVAGAASGVATDAAEMCIKFSAFDCAKRTLMGMTDQPVVATRGHVGGGGDDGDASAGGGGAGAGLKPEGEVPHHHRVQHHSGVQAAELATVAVAGGAASAIAALTGAAMRAPMAPQRWPRASELLRASPVGALAFVALDYGRREDDDASTPSRGSD